MLATVSAYRFDRFTLQGTTFQFSDLKASTLDAEALLDRLSRQLLVREQREQPSNDRSIVPVKRALADALIHQFGQRRSRDYLRSSVRILGSEVIHKIRYCCFLRGDDFCFSRSYYARYA